MATTGIRTSVYIDGYNLYYGRLRHSEHKWLDVVRLFESLLKAQDPGATLTAVKFFTAPALPAFSSQGMASVIAQQSYHRALEALHGRRLKLVLGSHSYDKSGTLLPTFIPGKAYDRRVRSRVWNLEEKQTDVNIAMAIYRDVAKGRCDQIVLCSNDSDAEPVLAAVREDFPQVKLGVVTPVRPPNGEVASGRRVSTSLSRHAHWTRSYPRDEELAQAQLPLQIPTRKKPIRKPSHW